MKVTIYDLVIGNIPGSHGLEEVVAVTAKAQEKHERQTIKPLIEARSDIPNVSAQVLKEAQQIGPTLKKLWEAARAETQQQIRGKTTYRYDV